jgi:hypothetical protein
MTDVGVFHGPLTSSGHELDALTPPPPPSTALWLAVARTVAVLHVVCFGLGAPLTSVGSTAAVYASIALPMALRFGAKRAADWMGSFGDARLRVHLVAGLVAAWSGAIVVPLDWAVWWQAWPIVSCALAAITSTICTMIGLLTRRWHPHRS